jgi:hypothetical protein
MAPDMTSQNKDRVSYKCPFFYKNIKNGGSVGLVLASLEILISRAKNVVGKLL